MSQIRFVGSARRAPSQPLAGLPGLRIWTGADDTSQRRRGQRAPPTGTMREMESILAAVREAPPRAGTTRVIAIDGRSGAGKSTLALALAGHLGAPLVALEDLYGGWDGLEQGVALLCSAVLAPLAESRAASVPRYDWQTGAWLAPWTLESPHCLVVEGVGAGALAAAPYTSMLVWLELAASTRRERALNRRAGDGQQWERWALQEDAFFAREHPERRADLVLTSRG